MRLFNQLNYVHSFIKKILVKLYKKNFNKYFNKMRCYFISFENIALLSCYFMISILYCINSYNKITERRAELRAEQIPIT